MPFLNFRLDTSIAEGAAVLAHIEQARREDESRTGRVGMALSGILNVDKPAGWTSFDVVRFVRGRCGERRVGHAGTLDPAATGVLPVLIGQATRLTEYLVDATKAYEATVELGVETDTYDAEGEVVARADASHVTGSRSRRRCQRFRGDFLQTPPMYSALKRDGVPLYKRARRGEAVEVEPRPVRVEELDITDWRPPHVKLHVECAKGFYVRSLAHDLGAALGVGGMLAGLRRSRVGAFRVEDAVDIEDLRAAFEAGALAATPLRAGRGPAALAAPPSCAPKPPCACATASVSTSISRAAPDPTPSVAPTRPMATSWASPASPAPRRWRRRGCSLHDAARIWSISAAEVPLSA